MTSPTPPSEREIATRACGAVVGPVWKCDGESWVCVLVAGHEGDHDGGDGTWWTREVEG